MDFNFKGKMHATYDAIQKIRSGSVKGEGKLSGRRDITLLDYLSATYPEGCGKDGVFDIQYLYNDLGINPNSMTVEKLINLDQDSKWLVPEIFRDAIRKGLRTSPFYSSLVAVATDVAQPQVNMPYFNLSDAEPQDTEERETISKGSISYGNKVVNITKQAIGVDISYEAIQYTTLSLLSVFIEDVGIKLGQKLNNSFVDVLINGDQDDASEAAAVIGVDNTTTGILYRDILYAWIRASRLGRQYSVIIAGESMANTILNLSEFKEKQAGTPQKSLILNTVIPSQSQLYVSAQVPADQAIFLDPNYAAAQLTSMPLMVEGEKIVSKQVQGTFASITTGFANIFSDARVIIDQSLDVSSNDFPASMTPTL